jgi:hypothetical protein
MTERPLRYVKTGARTKDSNPHLHPYTDLYLIDHPTHKSAPKTVRFFKLQTIDFLHQTRSLPSQLAIVVLLLSALGMAAANEGNSVGEHSISKGRYEH